MRSSSQRIFIGALILAFAGSIWVDWPGLLRRQGSVLQHLGEFACIFSVFAIILLAAALLFIGGAFDQRRRDPKLPTADGRCPSCGYDIRATRVQCPECGFVF